MAKATAICTCKKCGEQFKRFATKANRREADSWAAWAEAHFDLCPTCYAKEQAEAENAKGLICKLIIKKDNDNDFTFKFILFGDTYSIKDQVKENGFGWDPADRRWNAEKYVTVSDIASNIAGQIESLKRFVEEIENMGFELKVLDHSNCDYAAEIKIAALKSSKKRASKPVAPEFLSGKWNGKFYGKNKNVIYVNNKEIRLDDEELESLHTYLSDLEDWKNKPVEIENPAEEIEDTLTKKLTPCTKETIREAVNSARMILGSYWEKGTKVMIYSKIVSDELTNRRLELTTDDLDEAKEFIKDFFETNEEAILTYKLKVFAKFFLPNGSEFAHTDLEKRAQSYIDLLNKEVDGVETTEAWFMHNREHGHGLRIQDLRTGEIETQYFRTDEALDAFLTEHELSK